jgi:chorismate mutase-like protein
MSEAGLEKIREKLDAIDNQLLELLNDRMDLVHEVGVLKAKSGGAIYRPEREKAIIDRLEKLNKGKLNRSAIEALFLEIFAISRNLELPENIAYLGPEGSFTHQAAEVRFGAMSSYLSIGSIKGVFREVSTKKAKYGVVPIENSSNGIVSDTISCLTTYNLKIIAEVVLNIHHTLATTCDKVTDIKKIYSKDISDIENAQSGHDKTSILVKLPNTPGALVDFLTDFDKAGINLTKIKSHIVEGISIFFIDFEGHKDDENVKNIFEKHKDSIKFLGSYVKEVEDI